LAKIRISGRFIPSKLHLDAEIQPERHPLQLPPTLELREPTTAGMMLKKSLTMKVGIGSRLKRHPNESSRKASPKPACQSDGSCSPFHEQAKKLYSIMQLCSIRLKY
jgi:hypothetical protein